MAFLQPDFLLNKRHPQSNLSISPSLSLLKFCCILIFLKTCNAILIAPASTFDAIPEPSAAVPLSLKNIQFNKEDSREESLSSSSGYSLENEETYNNYNTNFDINNYNMYRMRRDSPTNSNNGMPSQYSRMNDLSRAFGRLHFGPLLRFRSISNRASPTAKFVTSEPPRVKKALSYLSRFYPMFQSSPSSSSSNSNSSPAQMQTLKSARRRLTASFSGESASFPLGRSHRPNMRLRWGK